MIKYIKWELFNEFQNKKILLLIIGIVYMVIGIIPITSIKGAFLELFYMAFIIILFISLFFSFIYGAKRTISSYKNKTFLLESMISSSPNKILLTKYFLAIFFNILWFLLFLSGVLLLLFKFDINAIKTLIVIVFGEDFSDIYEFIRTTFLIFISTITFTSLSTFVFVSIKSYFPNFNIGSTLTFIISYFIGSIILQICMPIMNDYWVSIILNIIFSMLCYFGTVYFVKNKFEVYN